MDGETAFLKRVGGENDSTTGIKGTGREEGPAVEQGKKELRERKKGRKCSNGGSDQRGPRLSVCPTKEEGRLPFLKGRKTYPPQ